MATGNTLYLTKIQPDQNQIGNLNNLFAKYGRVLRVEVSYNGDPEAAAITFISHEEAIAAYHKLKPVLNNQGVDVSWNISLFSCASAPSTTTTSTPKASGRKSIIFKCDRCDKIVANKRSLEAHMTAAHTVYQCPVCHADCESNKSYINQLNAEHSNAKPFVVSNKMSIQADSKVQFKSNENIQPSPPNGESKNSAKVLKMKIKLKKKTKETHKAKKKATIDRVHLKALLEEKNEVLKEKNALLDILRKQNEELSLKLTNEQKKVEIKDATLASM